MQIRRGDQGPAVTAWQRFLISRGYSMVNTDGVFGPNTERATRSFQLVQHLSGDGVVGDKTIAAAANNGFTGFGIQPPAAVQTFIGIGNYTDEQILDRVRSLPTYQGMPDHLEAYVRSRADQFDAFDDLFLSFRKTGPDDAEFVMKRRGTTNAGSYGLLHFDRYNHLGCAVLKSDHLVYDSHVWGLHHGKDAYRQNKVFPYFRDNNRNQRAEEIGPELNDMVIGANIHRAGVNSTVIANWSTACQVTANLALFLDWLHYLDRAGRPPVSLVILSEF